MPFVGLPCPPPGANPATHVRRRLRRSTLLVALQHHGEIHTRVRTGSLSAVNTRPDYVERLIPPPSWWLMAAAFGIGIGLTFVVAVPLGVALLLGLAAAALVMASLWRYAAVIVRVDANGLTAGRALLPWEYVGTVTALDAPAARRAFGAEADATAYTLLRAYCRGAVRVEVDDELDRTPYWLVSTRQPQRLAASLAGRAVQD